MLRRIAPVALLAACSAGVIACGEAPPPPAAEPGKVADASEQARINDGKKKIDAANRAYSEQKYDEARTLLLEAKKLDVESQRFDITELMDKVDKRFAKASATDVADSFKAGDCAGAFKELAKKITELDSEAFTRELRGFILKPAGNCLNGVVEKKTKAGDYAAARALVEAPETATVLGAPAAKKATTELDALIVEGLRARIAPDLKAKRWEAAATALDEAVKKGDASDAHAREVRTTIREALTPELDAIVTDGIGSRTAAAGLARMDKLLAIAGWEVATGDAVAQDRILPEKIATRRLSLATWVEAQRVRIKLNKRAEKRWAWGAMTVAPPDKIDGASKRDLATATEVWVIGQTRDRALIATEEPSSSLLPALMEKATGWVPVARLAPEPTVEWLPPDDQLKGARVWGPLRAPEPLLEIGTVIEITGSDVSVKRAADDAVVKVARRSLRSGRLSAGTKVVTFCTEKGQVGTIAEVAPDGRTVKITCEGGAVKEETLASLRTKPELLPAGKK